MNYPKGCTFIRSANELEAFFTRIKVLKQKEGSYLTNRSDSSNQSPELTDE
ncbi:MAG: hypothetical protein PHU81_02310 [Acidobacteriota bacterium]|nr:hypothetical protein [Acidobacteriota bacterium]